jgi:hypothetical protein
MRKVAVAAFAMLAACAETPQQILDEGLRFQVTSKSSPRLAALCAARFAEQIPRTPFVTQMREMETAGDYEVIVRYVDEFLPFAVIHSQAKGGTTSVVIRTQSLPKHIIDALVDGIRARC